MLIRTLAAFAAVVTFLLVAFVAAFVLFALLRLGGAGDLPSIPNNGAAVLAVFIGAVVAMRVWRWVMQHAPHK